MAHKVGGLAIVDAGCVETDGFNRAILNQPFGSVWMQAGKMQFGHGLWTALVGAQIFQTVRPVFAEAGANEHNEIIQLNAVRFFPCHEISLVDEVVPVSSTLFGNINHDAFANQPLERNLID